MFTGIVAHQARLVKGGVLLGKCWLQYREEKLCRTWEEALDFLVVDWGKAFSITWSLQSFANALFTLLPRRMVAEFDAGFKVQHGGCKIFYSKHLLGLTYRKSIKANFVTENEINFFQIEHWLDSDSEPKDIDELREWGERLIVALEQMGLFPRSLSSPVKAFVQDIKPNSFPTAATLMGEVWQSAIELALVIGKREWHSCYQVGYFPMTFLYDIAGAYPSILADLPNTDMCIIKYAETPPDEFNFALLEGTVEITAPISPIVDGNGINPVGCFEGEFTSEEIHFIEEWKLGRFEMKGGYFLTFTSDFVKPYRYSVNRLWELRQSPNKIVQNIARRAAQGLSGLLDESYPERYGDYYNPIYAAMVRSRCRLRVADFIYRNGLLDSAIQVQVDSVLSSKSVDIDGVGGLGSWRLKEQSPALVLSRGQVWRQSGGSLHGIVKAFKAKPRATHYEVDGYRIDLSSPTTPDRKFRVFPKNGGQILSRIYRSEPINVGGKK